VTASGSAPIQDVHGAVVSVVVGDRAGEPRLYDVASTSRDVGVREIVVDETIVGSADRRALADPL
jgi:hypothetical protein